MNILILGGGGREHALAWKLSQSKRCKNLYISPGNTGTMKCGKNIAIALDDFEGILQFSLAKEIDLVVVGPEGPLVDGITDAFRKGATSHIGIVGPSSGGAQLEGSKIFAKKFMNLYNIPTAGYIEVTGKTILEGIHFMENSSGPYVLKADGLAAGKGVLIINDLEEAKTSLHEMLGGKFGKASEKVVIEEFLSGREFSFFALTDGKDYILLPEAKDYKRIGEEDTGLNTGGMGAVSPVPFVDEAMRYKVIERIVKPTIEGIYSEGMDYTGFVFFGLIEVNGDPFVIEYNCRLGDPETEAIIPRIDSDLVDIFDKLIHGKLKEVKVEISEKSAATIMMVSGGYPGNFEKGKHITGIDNITSSLVFHAGTKVENEQIVTDGGRVMAVTSLHNDFRVAVKISLENADRIMFVNKYFRSDIGFDL